MAVSGLLCDFTFMQGVNSLVCSEHFRKDCFEKDTKLAAGFGMKKKPSISNNFQTLFWIRWLVKWANYNYKSYKEVENVLAQCWSGKKIRDAYTNRYSLVYKLFTEVYYYLDK